MGNDPDGFEGWWLLTGPLAALGTIGCAVIVAASYAPGAPRLPDGVVVPVCVGAFPVLLLSIVTLLNMRQRRRDVLGLIESSAPSAWPLAALLFVLFWVFSATGVADSKGTPGYATGATTW